MEAAGSPSSRVGHSSARSALGWIAVGISALLACFWAFWGINENFHEGWYDPSLLRNLLLMLVQYLSPMLIVLLLSLLALRWPRLAFAAFAACALAVGWFLHRSPAAVAMIVLPLLLLSALYHFGRPQPRRWAWRLLVGLPLITLVACGVDPAWRATHRFDDGNYGMRTVVGNGVTLVWAPEGPGWPPAGASWYDAERTCASLAEDAQSLSSQQLRVWRLPTTDEAVRSLVFHGNNAGGAWDPALRQARYRVDPEKDSPLWKVHSPVIYWWTAAHAGTPLADYVTYNGFVQTVSKRLRTGDLSFRCVRAPTASTPESLAPAVPTP